MINSWLLAGNKVAAPRSAVLWRETFPGRKPMSLFLIGLFAAFLASLSTIFNTGVDFPRFHSISRCTRTFDLTERNLRQSSLFSIGLPYRFLQPFFLQNGANLWYSFTYFESVR